MHDVSSVSADFFDRATRIRKSIEKSVKASISSNVPETDQQLIQLYLWADIAKMANEIAGELKEMFHERYNTVSEQPGFNGPIAAGEYAVLELQVRKASVRLNKTALVNNLRKRGMSKADIDKLIDDSSDEGSPSRILTVKPKV